MNAEGFLELELHEIIQANQLIRNKVKFNEFNIWFDSLSNDEKPVLITELYEFSCQAGFNNAVLLQVFSEMGINKHNIFYDKLNSIGGDIDDFEHWYISLNIDDRLVLFKIIVYLFGKAENYVYENESVEDCNHWWHRDLTDPKIVSSLLKNPLYYQTSRSDDLKQK